LHVSRQAFFPNYGTFQPGCGLDIGGVCAHGRAYEYYAESLNNNRFNSLRCPTFDSMFYLWPWNCIYTSVGTGIMGGDAAKSLKGVFFLETNNKSPYTKG